MRTWFLKILFPVLKRIGYIRLTWQPPGCALLGIEDLEHLLEPGMVILTYKHGCLSNWFIPGELNHAAMVTSSKQIVEAVHPQVDCRDIDSWVKSFDKICIYVPKFCSENQAKSAAEEAKNLLGKRYDWLFSMKNKAFYCSELIYFCYKKAMGEDLRLTKGWLLGEAAYTPNDIYTDRKNWKLLRSFGK